MHNIIISGTCHATDGPPKIGPPDHLRKNMHVTVDGPPGPSMAATDGSPDHLWCRRWSPIATDGPP